MKYEQGKEYKTFTCHKNKCLTCPLSKCIYDTGKSNIILDDGTYVKVKRTPQTLLGNDITD